MSVRDSRRAPFCWQSVDALELIRSAWDPPDSVSIATGLNVYRALTEVANETRARAALAPESEGFEATRKQLAQKAGGVNVRTVDFALAEIDRLGLVRVERRKLGDANLPNLYVLVEPGSEMISPGGEQISLGGQSSREGGEISTQGVASSSRTRSRSKENEEVPPQPPQGGAGPDPPRNGRRRDHDRYAEDLVAFHESLKTTPAAEEAWAAALKKLTEDLPASTRGLYIDPLELVGDLDGELYLTAPLPVVAWIERKYRDRLQQAVGEDYGVVVIPQAERVAA